VSEAVVGLDDKIIVNGEETMLRAEVGNVGFHVQRLHHGASMGQPTDDHYAVVAGQSFLISLEDYALLQGRKL